MESLKLVSISKSYNEIEILKNVNLEIKQKESVCLFGPSGSGKSSILLISAGILSPDKGDVFVMNQKLEAEEKIVEIRRKHFGFIFQFHNLIPELNVLENVMIHQQISGKVDKEFAKFLLSELGIYEKRNYPVQLLSGGEAQRTSVARAFASKPSIVFADEPTGSLDPKTAEKTINLITDLAKKLNSSLLAVSHNYSFKSKFDGNFELSDGNLRNL